MALVATTAKARVVNVQPGLWNIVIHVEVRDNGTVVIDKEYSVFYRSGDKLGDKVSKFVDIIQPDIDKYVSEQIIYNSGALTLLTNAVKNKLDLENSK